MAPSACAACRSQRKKCSDECLLAPHFPSDDLQKFGLVQKVYGFNNVLKMLKDVKAEQRADVVKSLVYEATARMEDPVYGCTREIHQLQKRIAEQESKLAATQAELLDMRFEHHNFVSLPTICDEVDQMLFCEPLWEVQI
ncbi:hypothetical protein SUGI_0891740 [Cryptomeria japonica]|uniref:LOB domain-containing protein 24-like n=1 Tax=Cryptomeria japonica TaxID=3369 RepID=UPI00241490FE|nr:LOB domain-containing protein 24-like [Cryptomeria japonica]GLJ42975.1 hypothetical protein SUGI_0891740 [Cryptomeria japonica]